MSDLGGNKYLVVAQAGAPDRFDLLALIVEDDELKRWPIEPPDTIEARERSLL